jgi:Skp family chaperone for outer membrane proteins
MNKLITTAATLLMVLMITMSVNAQEKRQIIIEEGRVVIKSDTTEIIIQRGEEGSEDMEDIEDEIEDIEEEIEDALEELEEEMEDLEEEIEEEIERSERVLQDENGVVMEDMDPDKEVEVKVGKKKRKNKFRVGMLDIGLSTYLFDTGDGLSFNSPEGLEAFDLNNGRLTNINLHIFRHRVNLLAETVFFEYGVSVNWRRYRLQNDNTLFDTEPTILDDGTKLITSTMSDFSVRKNKLRSSYLEIPVMLTISPKDSKFFVSGGGFAGVRMGASQKIKSEQEGKLIIKDDFEMQDFNYGLVGRFGFGPVDFYCQYSLVPLFDDDVSPELYPISFGISILGF